MIRIEAVPATDEVLSLAHSKNHIQKVRETIYSDKTVKGERALLERH